MLGCLDAAYEKYASELRGSRVRDRHDDDGSAPPSQSSTAPLRAAPVVFNGKVAEEVGFDTARERLANLAELRIVLLDGLLVRGVLASADDENDRSKYFAELEEISRTLRKATDLDLSRNLLEDWQDVADICSQLKDLQHLRLMSVFSVHFPYHNGLLICIYHRAYMHSFLVEIDLEVLIRTTSSTALRSFSLMRHC